MKRGLCLLLTLLMVIACFAACGPKTPTTPDTPDPVEEDDDTNNPLPVANYQGKTYTVLNRSDSTRYTEEWTPNTSLVGDVVNNAVATRNQAVEKRYSVTLDFENQRFTADEVLSKVQNAEAGDTYFQLIASQTYRLAVASTRGFCLNWLNEEQVPVVNLAAEWWDGSFTREAQYNGCSYIATGPLSLSGMYATACIYFNKDMLKERLGSDSAVDDLYTMVLDGKWTLDQLIEYARKTTKKVDGDDAGTKTIYGLSSNWNNPVDAFIYASDLRITKKEGNKITLIAVDKNNKLNKLANTLKEFFNDSGNVQAFGAKAFEGTTYPELVGYFVQEKSVFSTGTLNSARDIQSFAQELDYGIIPYPKYDASQKDYSTFKFDYRTSFAITKAVAQEDREFVGTITEALAYYSNKYVKTALYERVLPLKNVKDGKSSECVKKILNSELFEFSDIYSCAFGDQQSPAHLLRLVVQEGGSFSQKYSGKTTEYNMSLNAFLKNFQNDKAAQNN